MRLIGLIFVWVLYASAQVTDGVTTSVGRTVNITPDEADFSVTVDTSLDVTQDAVVQAFHDAGIQNVTVVGVGTGNNP